MILTVSAIAAIMLSFMVSLIKNALSEMNSSHLEQLGTISTKAADIWQTLIKENRYRSIVVMTTIDASCLIIASVISFPLFVRFFGMNHLTLFIPVICVILVLLTKVLPGILGHRHKLFIAKISAPYIAFAQSALKPFALLLKPILTALDTKRFTTDKCELSSEILALSHCALLENKISREQEQLIRRTLDLKNLVTSQIMVKREAIHFLSTNMSLSEALIAAHFHNHTRFPLAIDGDVDKIIGYINFKDIVGALRLNPENPTLGGIMRPINFVNPFMPLSKLFRVLTGGYKHIAVVRDASGKTVGMVTLENLVETLVGDLKDEYDIPADYLVQLTEHRFKVGGGASFKKLHSQMTSTLPDWDLTMDEWIAGLCCGKIPEGYTTEFEGVEFKVRRLSRGRVFDLFATTQTKENINAETSHSAAVKNL